MPISGKTKNNPKKGGTHPKKKMWKAGRDGDFQNFLRWMGGAGDRRCQKDSASYHFGIQKNKMTEPVEEPPGKWGGGCVGDMHKKPEKKQVTKNKNKG